MLTLSLRTDNPEAEIGLYDNGQQVAHEVWHAHRQLAETIHGKIRDLLHSQDKMLNDLDGIMVFRGPGSFTGLRIGIAVANALADGLDIPIAGSNGKEWISGALAELGGNPTTKSIQPEYGAPPHITKPRH